MKASTGFQPIIALSYWRLNSSNTAPRRSNSASGDMPASAGIAAVLATSAVAALRMMERWDVELVMMVLHECARGSAGTDPPSHSTMCAGPHRADEQRRHRPEQDERGRFVLDLLPACCREP